MPSWCRGRVVFLACCLALGLPACAAPPQREIDQAQGAVDAARAAGGERYAPDEFRAATEALKKSHEAVAQRDYRLALSHALDAHERAQAGAKQAASQRALVRSQAERGLATTERLLDRLDGRLKAARAARVPARRLTQARAVRTAVAKELQKARAALKQEDYLAARDAMRDVSERVEAALQQVDAAIAARPARTSRQPR